MSLPEPQYSWLWCDDNQKVTDWFLSVADRHDYDLFYSSFINIANKIWMKSLDPRAKMLQPLEMRIVDCLLEEPIPANALIDVLKEYNQLIGGTKGDIKATGLIRWTNEPPTMAAMEAGVRKLYKLIVATWRKCCRADDSDGKPIEDEETVDTEAADEMDKSRVTFELAIVGGKKNNEDQDMA
ncbi:hypothetical protein KCU93_g10214, partial [Aureobasidium melanogenum]